MSKPPGTEDTVAESVVGTEATLAGPSSQGSSPSRSRNDSSLKTIKTIGDALRGANIASFDAVERSRFEMLGELARGGLGRVMRARDPRTGRIVALKEIIVSNHETVARFAREALVTANLQHPSIVPVYEVGRWPNGEPFYAMKLVQGRTLTELIAQTKTAADRLALLPHAIAVAEALAYAHSEHVIHRDLKPSNVLVGSYGETVVIDWGLARNTATGEEIGALSNPSIDLGTDTVLGTVIGTPAYMPPEQALGAPIDEGADVYAIGALMYHMLSGSRPYADATSIDAVIERVKTGPPVPLASLAPEVPPDLVAIVEKAMARSLSVRYRTAGQLAEDLRRFQLGKLVGAHRYTTWQLVRRWVGQHRAILATAVAGLVVLAIVGAISVRRIASERDEAQQQRTLAQHAEQLAVERYSASLEELARQASVAGNPDRAMPILAGVSSEHRTPATGILAGQSRAAYGGLVALAPSQLGATISATITPDGTRLVQVSGKGKVIAWDLARGTQVWTAEGISAVELSPDGALLLTAGDAVGVRSVRDGKELGAWKLGEEVRKLAWSSKGDRFAAGGANGALAIGTVAGGIAKLERCAGAARSTPGGECGPIEGHAKRVWGLAFSPSGELLASAAEDGVVIVQGGARPARRLVEGKGTLATVAWLDDTHVVAGGEDHLARVWDVATGTVLRRFDHGIDIYGVAVGKGWLATYGYGPRVAVWPIEGGAARDLVGNRLGVDTALAVGDTLITADEFGQVIAWDPTTGERLRTLPVEGQIQGLVAAGDLLAVFGDGRTRVWRLPGHEIVRRLTGHTARVRDTAFVGGAVWTTSNDGSARSFGLDGKPGIVLGAADFTEPIITGPGDPNAQKPPNPRGVRSIAAAPDGKRIATTYEDGRIELWDAATGAHLASWTGHTARVRSLAFSADGATAYSVGDTTVRKWNAATGAELARAPLGGPGWAVAIHGDAVVTQTDQGALGLWAAATLAPLATSTLPRDRLRDLPFIDDLLVVADEERVGYLDPHTGKLVLGAPEATGFSVSVGEHIVAVGDGHGDINLFDRATLARIRSWRSGDEMVAATQFRPDGKILATASAGNVRIWDLATGAVLAELRGLPTMILRLAWSPDGTRLAISGGAPTVWLWDLTPAEPGTSCATPWRLVDGTLVEAQPAAWCAPAATTR